MSAMTDRDEKLKVVADYALDLGLDDVAEVVRSEMRLWVVSLTGYDGTVEYDSFTVAAADADAARRIHPYQGVVWDDGMACWRFSRGLRMPFGGDWPHPDALRCECVGFTSLSAGTIVCVGFNAG